MSNELQQQQQKIWIKEQEINALKVQNRHLIAKLEQAEANAKPNHINTQQIAQQIVAEIQTQLRPTLSEIQKQSITAQSKIEKSLTQAFDMMQATLRGVYQQSQRAQQAVESLSEHSKGIETRVNETRKTDQTFYQEKIFSVLVTFFERVERQLDQRLSALGAVEHVIVKQNEALNDLESLKVIALGIQKSTETSRSEISRIEKGLAETAQKMIEVEVQGRNGEEITRDALQQIQNHRAEFKAVRGDIRSMIDHAQRLNEKIALVDEHLDHTTRNLNDQQREQDRIRNELNEIEAKDSIENLIETKGSEIASIQEVIEATESSSEPAEEKEDLVMILDLLRSQKADLRKVAKDAENYLKDYRSKTTAPAVAEPTVPNFNINLKENNPEITD